MSEPKDDLVGHAGKALQEWLNLPDEERSEERPWIMGFNAAWEIQNDRLEAQANLIEALQTAILDLLSEFVGEYEGEIDTVVAARTLLASIKEPT